MRPIWGRRFVSTYFANEYRIFCPLIVVHVLEKIPNHRPCEPHITTLAYPEYHALERERKKERKKRNKCGLASIVYSGKQIISYNPENENSYSSKQK
jgi:hypothetical protein